MTKKELEKIDKSINKIATNIKCFKFPKERKWLWAIIGGIIALISAIASGCLVYYFTVGFHPYLVSSFGGIGQQGDNYYANFKIANVKDIDGIVIQTKFDIHIDEINNDTLVYYSKDMPDVLKQSFDTYLTWKIDSETLGRDSPVYINKSLQSAVDKLKENCFLLCKSLNSPLIGYDSLICPGEITISLEIKCKNCREKDIYQTSKEKKIYFSVYCRNNGGNEINMSSIKLSLSNYGLD